MQKLRKDWFKASASSNDGTHCVEARIHSDGAVDVRDSKQIGAGPVLSFTREEWAAFLDGARKGEFDN